MARIFRERGEDTDTQKEKIHVEIEAEIGTRRLLAQESPEARKEAWNGFSIRASKTV